jgi:hypothetical protein
MFNQLRPRKTSLVNACQEGVFCPSYMMENEKKKTLSKIEILTFYPYACPQHD